MSFDEFTSKLMENKDLCDALAEAIKGQKLDDFLKEQRAVLDYNRKTLLLGSLSTSVPLITSSN